MNGSRKAATLIDQRDSPYDTREGERERQKRRAVKVLVRDLRFDVDSLKQKIPKKLSMFARLNASLQLRVLFAPRQLQRLGSHRLAHLLRIPCQLLDKPPQPLSLTLSLFV